MWPETQTIHPCSTHAVHLSLHITSILNVARHTNDTPMQYSSSPSVSVVDIIILIQRSIRIVLKEYISATLGTYLSKTNQINNFRIVSINQYYLVLFTNESLCTGQRNPLTNPKRVQLPCCMHPLVPGSVCINSTLRTIKMLH